MALRSPRGRRRGRRLRGGALGPSGTIGAAGTEGQSGRALLARAAGRPRRYRSTVTLPAPRLSNVLLRVSSIEASLRFYRDLLGLPVLAAFEGFAFLDAGGARIGLNAVPLPAEPSGGLAALTEIVLEVPDVQGAYAELTGMGIAFRTAPRPVTEGGDRALWACDCRDPDGHLVSITGWVMKPR